MPVITDLTGAAHYGRRFRYYDEIESTKLKPETSLPKAPRGHGGHCRVPVVSAKAVGPALDLAGGKGLLFSVILRPAPALTQAHSLTMVAATAPAWASRARRASR